MSTKDEDLEAFAGTLIGLVLLWPPMLLASALLHGYVLSKLWGWFVYQHLSDVPMDAVQATGVVLILSLIHAKARAKNAQPELRSALFINYCWPLAVLAIGWTVSLWV